MNTYLRTLSVYITAYCILLMLCFGLLYANSKLELHLLLNSCHSSALDTFFKYYSILAEWPLYVLALLPLLWKKYGTTLFFALSEVTGGGFLQLLKCIINTDRPVSVFEHYPDVVLPLVPGVNMHYTNSFPSGHASTFFVFCSCCALLLAYQYQRSASHNGHKNWLLFNAVLLVLLILAALGAYSRIYLSQHFMWDVCIGSIIGFVTPFLIFHFARNKILKLNHHETS